MLGAANRLRDRSAFAAARERGRRWRGDLLILNTLQRAPDAPARFGFVVSRKIGNAVTRNRVKRRLRAIVRSHIAEVARGYDVIFIARPGAGDAGYASLDSAALHLLQLARLISSSSEVST